MARRLVTPRIGVHAKGKQVGSTQRDMRDILGWFDQFVYDDVAHKYFAATRTDLPG